MEPVTDCQLLRRYIADGDHDAFAELVRRYVSFVHSAARRQTGGDTHLADDVTQAVMIVLARRAGSISSDAVLSSWLFTVTRHAAQNAMKLQARQRFHERRALAAAARVERPLASPDASGNDLRDVLDDAIARLPEPDRSGVVLHFLQDRPHAEVGAALGLSAEAARKRVERALEKMRVFLAGRGVVTTGAAICATLQSESASATAVASAQLAASAFNVAILAGAAQAASSPGSLAIAKGVTHMLALAKLKAAAAVILVGTCVAGAGVGVAPLLRQASSHTIVHTATSAALVQEPPAADAAGATAPYAAKVNDAVRLEFLGVSPYPGDEQSWFSIAGEPIEQPALPDHDGDKIRGEPDFQMLIRVHAPRGVAVVPQIEGARMSAHTHDRGADDDAQFILTSRFAMQNPADSMSMQIGVASSKWKTIATHEKPQEPAEVDAGKYGAMTFEPVEADPDGGRARVSVTHEPTRLPARGIAVDEKGQEYEATQIRQRRGDAESESTYTFELPPEKVRRVEVQVREFDKFVEVKDVSLSPDNKTKPTITVTEGEKGK